MSGYGNYAARGSNGNGAPTNGSGGGGLGGYGDGLGSGMAAAAAAYASQLGAYGGAYGGTGGATNGHQQYAGQGQQQQQYGGAGGYGGGQYAAAYGAAAAAAANPYGQSQGNPYAAFGGQYPFGTGGGQSATGYGQTPYGSSVSSLGSSGGGGGGYRSGNSSGGGGGPMSADRQQRSVFVGNIPYKATEEELIQLFSQAGSVVAFRLVNDRDTGRPKGFGFCEYSDESGASMALQLLNGTELHGRPLRVGSSK